jgi:NADPH:quinone reductase-like Zn-dependent oxidoreductase
MTLQYLIYGASSSVGLFAIQLAVRMGYKVIAVCSPHNHSLVKSLGASEVLDYSDGAKTSQEIKKITGGGVSIGLDTISEGKSWEISVNGFKEEGGRLNGILPPNQEAQDMAKGKKVELQNTLMYTLFGKVGTSLLLID